jgi:antiviral helicase SKI2
MVELLFSEGLIKVLFATETFAMGINMPTKTVIFNAIRKVSGSEGSHRFLNSSEYVQMSGRAGRRGLDEKGNVIIIVKDPNNLPDSEEMVKMMDYPG